MTRYTRRDILALGLGGLGFALLGTGCATTNGPLARVRTDKPILLVNDATTTQELAARIYAGNNPYAFANAQHIAAGVKDQHGLDAIINAAHLEAHLRERPGTPFKNGTDKLTDYAVVGVAFNGPQDVSLLNEGQRLRLGLLLNALDDTTFRNTVEQQIRLDYADKNTEYGGLVLAHAGTLRLHPVAGVDTAIREYQVALGGITICPIFDSNSFYLMPPGTREKTPHSFGYHIHAALADNRRYCGPSITLHPALPGGLGGDIGFVKMKLIPRYGEANEVIFTPLTGEKETPMKFNVAVLFGRKEGNEDKMVLINAGDWTGE